MNKKNYKFSELTYERPDFEALQKALDKLVKQVENAKDYEEVREVIFMRNQLSVDRSYAENIAMIRNYQDSTDKFYEEESLKIAEGTIHLDESKLSEVLIQSPFHKQIEEEFGRQYLTLLNCQTQLFKKGKDLMVQAQTLELQYQQLKASLRFEMDGTVMGEAKLYKYLESTDREVRRKAMVELNQVYIQHKEEFETILDQLVKLRIQIAKENGFANYFEYINLEKGRTGYGETELTAFCNQVKEVLVPFCSKLNEAKKKRLGLTELKIYDQNVLFPDGNPEPNGTTNELFEAASKMYHKLSKEAGEFFDLMLEHELIDVEPSQNKVAGIGFCTDIAKLKMPFVFGNFNGTISDVTVLTHEIGHAFQTYVSMQKQPLIEFDFGVNDISEVPSKTMEQFTYPYAENFFGKDADKFRFMHLCGVMEEICIYCMIHEFETYLYTTPDATPKERELEFAKTMAIYHPDYDMGEMAEYIEKGAPLFRSMAVYLFPRYVVSYSLSNMCALEFKQKMNEHPKEAWEEYTKLCSAGGSLGYPELLKLASLSLAYEDGVIARVTKYAQETLEEYIRKEQA